MRFFNFISENAILPLSDFFSGQTVHSKWKFLQKSQFWSRGEIESFQNERLKSLVTHANDNVPYYKKLFAELKLKPEDIKTRGDLIKLPVLTKQIIKQEGVESFTSLAMAKKELMKRGSSGSTGEPLFYYSTKEAYSMDIAANLRGWYGMGYRLGDKYVKLSQNPRNNPVKKLQDRVSRNLYLATNPLIESNFEYILREIERYKPKIIRCYPDPLLFLARYRQNHPEFIYNPVAIATTGNTLFPETRMEIESAFGCKIFDFYSCEGNSTVFECLTHACYHSTEEYGISEIIDDLGTPITKGIGRLITTDLWNLAHPFIRYDTQDLVEVDPEPCICGRKHLKFLRVIGRDNEILEMKTGKKYIVHSFTGFFQTDHTEIKRSINQFQVVKRDSVVIFRLVVNQGFTESVTDYIKKYWEKELNSKVEVEIVENIPLTKSGKRKFIINE
jgi:phenylacetate-CoA ligase